MNLASTAGWTVTVSGLGFGSLEATPTTTIGVSHCLTAAWASSTSAVCLLSPGEGVGKDGFMTVSGIVGTRSEAFSYDGAHESLRYTFATPGSRTTLDGTSSGQENVI